MVRTEQVPNFMRHDERDLFTVLRGAQTITAMLPEKTKASIGADLVSCIDVLGET